jgi:mono/diheme cytochrome c family protein
MIYRHQDPQSRTQESFLWISGYCALPLALIVLALLFLSGCSGIQRDPPVQVWDDMKRQNKFMAELENNILPDGRDSRVPPEGTVARDQLDENTVYYTGMDGDYYAGKSPVPTTMEEVKKGQAKFATYCTPCHGRVGTGQGIVPLHVPTWLPADLTEQRVVEFADGEIFNVITNGRRTMPPYKYQISVEDRWAIISYVRVLQRAAHGSMSDVPEDQKADLEKMH